MNPVEFEIGGAKYRAMPMPALVAWDVGRKISQQVIAMSGSRKRRPGMADAEIAAELFALCKYLSDEDDRLLRNACLSRVWRSEGGNWPALMSSSGEIMFPLELADLIQIVYRVLDISKILNVFPAPPSASAETGAPPE